MRIFAALMFMTGVTSHPALDSTTQGSISISSLLAAGDNSPSSNANTQNNPPAVQDNPFSSSMSSNSFMAPGLTPVAIPQPGTSRTRPCSTSADCRKSECCLSGSCSGSGHSGGMLDVCYSDVAENGGETPQADWTSTDSCPCQKGFHCFKVSPQSTKGFCMGGGGGGNSGLFSLLGGV